MMMLKRWMTLLLAALLLVGGACAETDLPEPEWNPAVVWVVRNGEVKYFVDDDTIMVFCVEYRSPQGEEDAPKCFWLNYQPEGADPWDPVVSIALAPDDHDLIPSDEGDYRLLIRETALREAYETWLAFCADDAQNKEQAAARAIGLQPLVCFAVTGSWSAPADGRASPG